ncbi:hypothetical protein LCGC14_0383580 [marine sediment metagenome]|uniref:Uncharacterized protein n=1 Tax=marine sediment metagenome TaxID=412755 RepID=A0A0F9T7N6_9ZZZZ
MQELIDKEVHVIFNRLARGEHYNDYLNGVLLAITPEGIKISLHGGSPGEWFPMISIKSVREKL